MKITSRTFILWDTSAVERAANLNALTERVFREESGRIVASLIRISGSFDWAEEAMQEAFASALSSWPSRGVPEKPGAWIMAVAHRKLIDRARRAATRQEKQIALEHETSRLGGEDTSTVESMSDFSSEYPDDRLRLIFTCCHPALNREAQIGLTLRTLGGLTTTEIARAFLMAEPALAQRLVRAKKKIREANIPYEIPPKGALDERLDGVQGVLYLIFNEGYSATEGRSLTRDDLCGEAIRLARILNELMPNTPENLGLLALMLLHHSRRHSRADAQSNLITLENQNRQLWDHALIGEGIALTKRALQGRSPGPYQLQAAIAAVHCEAPRAEETDWRQIVLIYEELARLTPTTVVALNHAVAVAMAEGPERGLALIDDLAAAGDLAGYYLFHASRADLLRRMQRHEEARDAYGQALSCATNRVERAFLEKRLEAMTRLCSS